MSQLPTEDTPVEITIAVVRAIAAWLDTYRAELAPELDEELDTGAEVLVLAHGLDLSWQGWQRERRDDVQLTADRDIFIGDTRAFLTALSSSVERRIRKQGLRENLLRDFVPKAPSYVRTPNGALRTLKIVRNGLSTHAQIFANADGHDLAGELDGQAATLIARAERLVDDEIREYGETRVALRTYERALDAALDACADLKGAAEASMLRSPAARIAFEDLLANSAGSLG